MDTEQNTNGNIETFFTVDIAPILAKSIGVVFFVTLVMMISAFSIGHALFAVVSSLLLIVTSLTSVVIFVVFQCDHIRELSFHHNFASLKECGKVLDVYREDVKIKLYLVPRVFWCMEKKDLGIVLINGNVIGIYEDSRKLRLCAKNTFNTSDV